MREKLKTLKDFEPCDCGGCPFPYQLKSEAIKWIKELNVGDSLGKISIDNQAQIKWIKHFFNISDEEIENEQI